MLATTVLLLIRTLSPVLLVPSPQVVLATALSVLKVLNVLLAQVCPSPVPLVVTLVKVMPPVVSVLRTLSAPLLL